MINLWLFFRKRAIVLAKRAIVDSDTRLWIVVARLWVTYPKLTLFFSCSAKEMAPACLVLS